MDYEAIAAHFLTPSVTPPPDPVVPDTAARRLRDALEPIATIGWWSRPAADRMVRARARLLRRVRLGSCRIARRRGQPGRGGRCVRCVRAVDAHLGAPAGPIGLVGRSCAGRARRRCLRRPAGGHVGRGAGHRPGARRSAARCAGRARHQRPATVRLAARPARPDRSARSCVASRRARPRTPRRWAHRRVCRRRCRRTEHERAHRTVAGLPRGRVLGHAAASVPIGSTRRWRAFAGGVGSTSTATSRSRVERREWPSSPPPTPHSASSSRASAPISTTWCAPPRS